MSYHFRRGLGDASYTDQFGIFHPDDSAIAVQVATGGVDTRTVQATGDQHEQYRMTDAAKWITYAPPALKTVTRNSDGTASCDYDVNPDRTVNKVGGGVWPGITLLPPKCCPLDLGSSGWDTMRWAPNSLAVPGSGALVSKQGPGHLSSDGFSYVYTPIPGSDVCNGAAAVSAPSGAVVTQSHAAAPVLAQGGAAAPASSGAPSFLSESLFFGLPNWMLIAGGALAAYAFSGGGNRGSR